MDRARRLTRIAAFLSLAGLVSGPASPLYAYRMWQGTNTKAVVCDDPGGFLHWLTAYTNWFHNPAHQGAGQETALRNAMAAWTGVPTAEHVLTYAGTTTNGFATDGMNSVSWSADVPCTDGCLALTSVVFQPGQVLVESDILFNNGYNWGGGSGPAYDVQAVATHEFGHALGISHTEVSSSPIPTMYFGYGGVGFRTLEADDVAALNCSQKRYCVSSGGVPPPPTSVNVVPAKCYGLNTVSWTAVPGATRYDLYRATSPSFADQMLLYSGLDRLHSINVTGTTYLRVRACNGSVCGCWRVGNRAATYTPGCL